MNVQFKSKILEISLSEMNVLKRYNYRAIESANNELKELTKAVNSLNCYDSRLRSIAYSIRNEQNRVRDKITKLEESNEHISYVVKRFEETDNLCANRFKKESNIYKSVIGKINITVACSFILAAVSSILENGKAAWCLQKNHTSIENLTVQCNMTNKLKEEEKVSVEENEISLSQEEILLYASYYSPEIRQNIEGFKVALRYGGVPTYIYNRVIESYRKYAEEIYLCLNNPDIPDDVKDSIINGDKFYDQITDEILISILESDADNVNYKKLLEIIDKNEITDFTYHVMMSIVNSEVRGKIEGEKEEVSYILGNNFEYLADYNGVSSYANFYTLMVDGEITLIRVGRDKTQVGFYDITNTDFFTQEFDKRNANEIFELYLPTTGLDTDLNKNKSLVNDDYKYYENKASKTIDVFWKELKGDSEVMTQLAYGLDTEKGSCVNGTGEVSDFGEVYEGTEHYPEKDNRFVLGEIYGHADGLNKKNWFGIAGDNKYRYWVADVENPNTISTKVKIRLKQSAQNGKWEDYAEGR